MTDPIEPATDEEIERWRRRCEFGTQGCVCDHRATDDRRNCITIDTRDNTIARIIARFDAEKARAEALYASCEQLHNEAGEWKARAEKAEADARAWEQIAADLRTAKSGVTYADVRDALNDVEAGEASFGGLIEVMRAAVETEIQRRFVEDGRARERAEKAEAQNARMREVLARDGGMNGHGDCFVCGACLVDARPHAVGCIVAELLREEGGG